MVYLKIMQRFLLYSDYANPNKGSCITLAYQKEFSMFTYPDCYKDKLNSVKEWYYGLKSSRKKTILQNHLLFYRIPHIAWNHSISIIVRTIKRKINKSRRSLSKILTLILSSNLRV